MGEGNGAAGSNGDSQPIKRRNKGWDNLKPCKPGEVRNPSGRPKRPSLKHAYLKELARVDPTDEKGKRRIVQAAAARALDIVLHGAHSDAIRALKEIREATAGSKVKVESGRVVSDFIESRFALYGEAVSVSVGDPESNRIAGNNGSSGQLRETRGKNGNGREAGE